jgi:hypothetical protein
MKLIRKNILSDATFSILSLSNDQCYSKNTLKDEEK